MGTGQKIATGFALAFGWSALCVIGSCCLSVAFDFPPWADKAVNISFVAFCTVVVVAGVAASISIIKDLVR